MFINLRSSRVTPRLALVRLPGMATSVGAVSPELRSPRHTSGVEPELTAPEPPEPGGAGPSSDGRILQVELRVARQRKPSAKAAESIADAADAAAAAAAGPAGPAPAAVPAAATFGGAAEQEADARTAAHTQQRKRSAQELRQLHQQRQRAEKQGAQQQRAELRHAELLRPAPESVAGNAR